MKYIEKSYLNKLIPLRISNMLLLSIELTWKVKWHLLLIIELMFNFNWRILFKIIVVP